MTKKPNFIYVFEEKEYTKEEENYYIARLAALLIEIEKESKAA